MRRPAHTMNALDVSRGASVTADPARPDILYLAHRLPYPPDKGDRIRTFHLLRHLSRGIEHRFLPR